MEALSYYDETEENNNNLYRNLNGGKKKSKEKKSKDKKTKEKKTKEKKDLEIKSDIEKVELKEEIKQPLVTNIYEEHEYTIEPIKLIYQYKNANRKTQYEIYVYVGVLGKRVKNILEKIKDMNIYDTIVSVTPEEEKKLVKIFGEYWVIKFFNKYHISAFLNKLKTSPKMKAEILKNHTDEWLTKLINNFKTDVVFKKVHYSYSELIKMQYKVRMGKKLEKVEIEKEDVEEDDFATKLISKGNILYQNVMEGGYKNNSFMEGGYKNNYMIGGQIEENPFHKEEEEEEQMTEPELELESEEEIENIAEESEDLTYEELEKIYQADVVDKNYLTTSELISKALENDKLFDKQENYLIKFDDSKDNDVDNDRLEDIYKKNFVYTYYLFKDDNIKTVKNKITCTIENNSKFGKQNYLIPSRLYLWSEYIINDNIESVMIGQKWMKKNELLKIDVVPLSIINYENLDGPIRRLRDTMKRYAGKIRREDEDSNILYDYENYMLNDELYMIDIYNELGLGFKASQEKINNLNDTFMKIYFPKIKPEDLTGIIDYLNDNPKVENLLIENTFETLLNDMYIEKEITDLVETTKFDERDKYLPLFADGNFIIQSQIHLNLEIKDEEVEEINRERMKMNVTGLEFGGLILPKLDLFRIFNDFTPSDRYPFIQYQVPDGQIIFKYYESYMYDFTKEKENIDIITKWFENSPYGISFKVKSSNDKFMSININEIGTVNYKTNWKEENNANINDIINTYQYIKDLVVNINALLVNHPRKVSIKIPEDWEFRFAYINCIQKFRLPDNKLIDHNDLSEFCRYFYPYVSLQIEPKKRMGKMDAKEEKSKYGTYLRYKRDTKYENESKIEQRILTMLRNFDLEEDIIIEEVAKQFNVTMEKAKEEYEKVKLKVPNIVKNKKLLKNPENLPKFKPSGINIDVIGKLPEKYRIRISGAKQQKQLERIILFMNIMIYLYSDTYILKNKERQIIKDKLKKLTNIAKRRSKVEEVVIYKKEVKDIKQMTQIDKKRLGFTPSEGHSQWSRYCQNSGKDKRRRPQQNVMNNLNDLIKRGYTFNKKTGDYEKKIVISKKKGKKEEIVLKALKVANIDETNNTVNEIYYTCNPENNGEHMYVGFLTKSNNPFGECMPCCFKIDPFEAKKKEKLDFYKRCMSGKKVGEEELPTTATTGDILYILQDTNKISEGRIGYLPKYIDFITNFQFDRKREIKNHYLLSTQGYYFKYGIKQEDYSFLNTLSVILSLPNNEIKKVLTEFLRKDTDENTYFMLNDGEIRSEFRIGDFIKFIEHNDGLDYYYLKDLMKVPGLFSKKGILPIVFRKNVTVIKRGIEKEKIQEDFLLDVDRTMISDFDYYMDLFENRDIVILIKESRFYYPMVEVFKKGDADKTLKIKKLFSYEEGDKDLINEIKSFFEKTIQDIKIGYLESHVSAKEAYLLLEKIAKSNNNYKVESQVVDPRYKSKYLITKNKTIVPVNPSGIVDGVPFICFNNKDYGLGSDCFSKLDFNSLENSNEALEELYSLTKGKLNLKPIGLFYDKIEGDDVNIIGITTSNNDLVPVKNTIISRKELDKNNVLYQNRPLYHILDQKLAYYSKDDVGVLDERIKKVNLRKYENESYELFRYELSNLINSKKYQNDKLRLKELIKKKDIEKIQDFILGICINKLNDKIINKDNTVGPELVRIIEELPNLNNYRINNQRYLCENLDMDKCSKNIHCSYQNGKCSFSLTQEYLLNYIKRLSYDIVEQDIKAYELLREKKYYVSDIVDYNNFTERPGQKIVKSSNTNLAKILEEIFGKEHIPKIGRRFYSRKTEIDLNQLLLENPLKDIKDAYSQTIIPNNYTIMRAYANGFYWNKHELYTVDIRNLGYYGDLQNELVNVFRSNIIDWLNIPQNIDRLLELGDEEKKILGNKILYMKTSKDLTKDNILSDTIDLERRLSVNKYIISLIESNIEDNMGLFELFLLNKIHKIPILISVNGIRTYYIDDGIEKIKEKEFYEEELSKIININMEFAYSPLYPTMTEVIYYK